MVTESSPFNRRGSGSRRGGRLGLLMVAVLTTVLSAQSQLMFSPARLVHGDLPGTPAANVVGGGEVLIEAMIGRDGRLTRPVVLRTTLPFSNMILDVIGAWRFTPAHGVGQDGTNGPVDSSVLIAAVYRPPTSLNGPTVGDPPKDVAKASADIVYPVAIVAPPYPPQALTSSVVLFEVVVDQTGAIKEARAVESDPGFDSAAREALLQWKFRPATYRGRPAAATAYVLFGFSAPVIVPGVAPKVP